ncbi:latent-transforming growth factor beta-binding protein 1-like [Patiria miniata]|uniref:Uncharacterized protein n=1 Tax=Patiria miniata TaxID=46514 RepID=A0A914BKC9_PATMI|nr:latent-transforming growth factor beta-binding protein 1-like [Patiria miniata]
MKHIDFVSQSKSPEYRRDLGLEVFCLYHLKMKVFTFVIFFLCLLFVVDLVECRRPRRGKQKRRRPKLIVPTTTRITTQAVTSPSLPSTTVPFIAAEACHRVCEGDSFLQEDLCTCDCVQPGFAYNERAGKCKDIDECEDESNCQGGTCTNLKGSYQCNCPSGYNLHANGKLCLPQPHVIPCRGLLCFDGASLDEDNCRCKCDNRGLMYDYFEEECVDINECAKGVDNCEHVCVNTMGSYRCHCYQGFRLNFDGESCDPIDPDCKDKAAFCVHLASAIECYYDPNTRTMCPKSCRVCVG